SAWRAIAETELTATSLSSRTIRSRAVCSANSRSRSRWARSASARTIASRRRPRRAISQSAARTSARTRSTADDAASVRVIEDASSPSKASIETPEIVFVARPPKRPGHLCCSPSWTRTNNLPVNSRLLCQLSYRGSLEQLGYFIKDSGTTKSAAAAPGSIARFRVDNSDKTTVVPERLYGDPQPLAEHWPRPRGRAGP